MKDKVVMDRRYSYFLAALLAKLKEDMEDLVMENGKAITKKQIAKEMGIPQGTLTNITNKTPGKRAGPKNKPKIAARWFADVEEMEEYGKALIEQKAKLSSKDALESKREVDQRPTPNGADLSALSCVELSATIAEYGVEAQKRYIDLGAEAHKRYAEVAKAIKLQGQEFDEVTRRLNNLTACLDHSPAIIKILRIPERTIVWRNQAHVKLKGKDLLDQPCSEDCIKSGRCICDKVLNTHAPVTEIVEDKENHRVYSILAWPVFDNRRNITQVVSVARDITDRYSEEGVARTAAMRFMSILDRASRTVYIYDEAKRLAYTNATQPGRVLEDVSPDDLKTFRDVAFHIAAIMVPEDYAHAIGAIKATFIDQEDRRYTARLLDGRVTHVDVFAIMDGDDFRGVSVLSEVVEADK